MIVKGSTNNFFTNFKYKVKSNFRVMVIILILHLVAAPLNLINMIIYMLNKSENINDSIRFNELYPVIGGISTCLAAAAGIIIAMNVFNYLYKKSVVDMTLALPMTTRQRFFSDFLSGAFTYLVPFIISGIISLIVNGIGASIVTDWNAEYGMISESLITLIIAGFFIMLMAYVLTVLVLTCCGSMFEAVAYTLIINGLIPGTIAAFGHIFLGNLYGIDLSSNIMPIIEKTSPIGALIGLGNSLSESSTLILKASWLIPFILITAVYFIGSYFLFMKRKAEQVSKPFVYKLFYYIMITGMTFCIGILFTLDKTSDNLGPLVVFTAIIYLIFEVITNRGFRKFYMSVIRYVVTIVAVIGLSIMVENSDGFGLVDKIPEASNVKSVEMNYNGVFNKFSNYWNKNDLDTYTDEDTINSVISMQKMLIENYHGAKESSNDYYESGTYNGYEAYSGPGDSGVGITNIEIKYNLKSGGSFTRTYYLNFEQFIQLMNVDKTEEFKDNYIQNIKDSYERNKESEDGKIRFISTIDDGNQIIIDKNKADEFLTCLALDIKALTDEEYYAPSKDTLAVLNIGYNRANEIAINENYASVLMFLKKYNINLPQTDYQKFNLDNREIQILKPENAALSVDGVDYYYSYKNYYKEEIGYYTDYSPEFVELLKHAQSNYITTEPCYMVYVNGESYIIPSEYSELAEKVFSQSGAVS